MEENLDKINCSLIYHEDKGVYKEELNEKLNSYTLPIEEYSDICVKCQLRHLRTKGFDPDGSFPVDCKGIPKTLADEGYYPLEKIYGEDYEKLSMEDKVQLQYKNNPLLWAKQMLGWSTYNEKRHFKQYYQDEILLCTAMRIAARLGRRMGKSEIIVIKALHYAMTTFIKNPHVLIIAPFMNLCDELHQRMIQKLDGSVFVGKYSSTKKPYTITIPRSQFNDVCTIKLFTTGSGSGNAGASTRGQSADMLFIDEAGYTDQESLEAVLPLVFEHDEVELTVTSTPSQMPNNFKKWCTEDKDWKDFHFPFTIMPNFEPGKKEYEQFKKMYGSQGWKQEVEAEFFEGNKKVFKSEDIKMALRDYNYPSDATEIPDIEDWRFVIGVDWNASKNGVQILLLGINMDLKKVKVWKIISVSNEEKQLQTKAISQIIELDRKFNADKIVVDNGYGAVQIEILLKRYAMMSREDKIVAVDFASSINQTHPITKEVFSKRVKCVMVSLLQQRFEYNSIILSRTEDGDIPSTSDDEGKLLTTQLDNYEVEKYDNRDNPVFKASGPQTDHKLDALLLANYGIYKYIEGVFKVGIGKRTAGGIARNDIANEIQQFLFSNAEKTKSKYSNHDMRENFAEVYDSIALDKEAEERSRISSSGGLNRMFGTNSRRLSRRSFR